jgi:hypothetical protein
VQAIEGKTLTVKLDGRAAKTVEIDTEAFQGVRHGYAGTIYKGQGRTLDQTYLYHSEHWRSAASYVALTRHRDKAALFVAKNTAPDVKQLARQMARVEQRRAASHFHTSQGAQPVRPLTAKQLHARFASEPHQTPTRGDKKELSFGADRDTKRRGDTPQDRAQGPAPPDERSRRMDEMLARRAAQLKDRDRGFTR